MFGSNLRCDGARECRQPVTMIDVKGFAYCTAHGQDRKRYVCRCRKLRPAEVKKLERGEPIARY